MGEEPSTGSGQAVHFLVMEYLEGDTLAQRLTKGPLPTAQVLKIAAEIADALDKAHRQGITHRDLKPGNIMLTKSGAKLLDFGLAKLRPPGTVGADGFSAAATQSEPLTAQGTILGTLQYMAPEQLEGKDADHRTDIFAFGAVVYEMATGQRAFAGDSQASLISAIMTGDPLPMSTLQTMTPPALDYVVKTCLTKDPDERWQSAGDVGRQVQGIIEGSSQSSADPLAAASHPVARRVSLGLAAAGVDLGAVVAGVAVWSLLRPGPESLAGLVIIKLDTELLSPVGGSPDLAFSADGGQIAYLDGARPDRKLKLRRLEQLTPTTLVEEGDPFHPFFSPDGEWVGFYDLQDAQLKKVSVDGGPALEICSLPGGLRGATWGADDTIVFGIAGSGLWSVDAGGGTPELLSKPDDDASHSWPQILPGGDVVVFTLTEGADRHRLGVMSLADGEIIRDLDLDGSSPHYSPTGHLVYAVDGTLRAVAFDIDRLEVSGGPVVVYEDVSTKSSGAANFGLSDEGTLVYVSGGTTALARSLVWVEPGTGRAEPLPLDPQEYGGPRLSPDGGDVAVSVTRSGTRGLYVYRVSNGREHPLVTDGFVSAAVWTPNGEHLVYRGGDGLYRVAADGSAEPERLLSGFNDTPSSVTPDGVLFFTRVVNGVAHRETWQIPLEGERTPTPVLFGELRQEAAHVSPLGDWMAFRSNETGADGDPPEALSSVGWDRDGVDWRRHLVHVVERRIPDLLPGWNQHDGGQHQRRRPGGRTSRAVSGSLLRGPDRGPSLRRRPERPVPHDAGVQTRAHPGPKLVRRTPAPRGHALTPGPPAGILP